MFPWPAHGWRPCLFILLTDLIQWIWLDFWTAIDWCICQTTRSWPSINCSGSSWKTTNWTTSISTSSATSAPSSGCNLIIINWLYYHVLCNMLGDDDAETSRVIIWASNLATSSLCCPPSKICKKRFELFRLFSCNFLFGGGCWTTTAWNVSKTTHLLNCLLSWCCEFRSEPISPSIQFNWLNLDVFRDLGHNRISHIDENALTRLTDLRYL